MGTSVHFVILLVLLEYLIEGDLHELVLRGRASLLADERLGCGESLHPNLLIRFFHHLEFSGKYLGIL